MRAPKQGMAAPYESCVPGPPSNTFYQVPCVRNLPVYPDEEQQGLLEPEPAPDKTPRWCNWPMIVCVVLAVAGAVLLAVFVTSAPAEGAAAGCATDLRLPNTTQCNRAPGLCAQQVQDVVFAGMHNAMAANESEADNAYAFVRPSHKRCLRSALLAGVRALTFEVHLRADNSELALCRAQCLPGNEMPLAAALNSVREFVHLNPREVVLLVWHAGFDHRPTVTAADRTLLAQKLTAAYAAHGLTALSYRRGESSWPTLGALVAQDTRVLSFFAETPSTWAMPESDLFIAHTLACTAETQASDANRLVVIHGTQNVDACAQCLGHIPNVIAADFWNSSSVVAHAHALNALTVEQRRARFARNTARCSSA